MTGRILVADDDLATRDLLKGLPIENRFTVPTARYRQAALESFHFFSPDLVLPDVGMRGVDGFEVCRKHKSAPEITVTARVLQLADIHDALMTDRPCRRARSSQDSLEVMQKKVLRGWWDSKLFDRGPGNAGARK